MIGIVIVAHDTLSAGLYDTLTHIVGPQQGVCAVQIDSDKKPEQNVSAVMQAVHDTNRGDGVVVVTDLYGGSPSNFAMAVNQHPDCSLIYGANMPLLLQLVKSRHHSLDAAINEAIHAGRKYMGCKFLPSQPDRTR